MLKLSRHLLFLLVTFSLSSFLSLGQSPRETAAAQIFHLKNGALIVRLKQNTLKLKAMEDHNHAAEAKEERRLLEIENKEAVMAFRTRYNFSKVYFFYAENSDKIRNRNFEGVLLDSLMKPASFPKNTPFLTGEFGQSERMDLDAFVLMDTNFVQLASPFPFMVKINGGGLVKRSKAAVVEILNTNLADFYQQSLAFKPRKKKK